MHYITSINMPSACSLLGSGLPLARRLHSLFICPQPNHSGRSAFFPYYCLPPCCRNSATTLPANRWDVIPFVKLQLFRERLEKSPGLTNAGLILPAETMKAGLNNGTIY